MALARPTTTWQLATPARRQHRLTCSLVKEATPPRSRTARAAVPAADAKGTQSTLACCFPPCPAVPAAHRGDLLRAHGVAQHAISSLGLRLLALQQIFHLGQGAVLDVGGTGQVL
jgi:hypothetical protein